MNINKYLRMNNDFLSQHFSISTSISQISALMDFFLCNARAYLLVLPNAPHLVAHRELEKEQIIQISYWIV
jgi:hypothetical protein